MKIITLILINIFFLTGISFAQDVKYQTFKAQMKLIGDKQGENFEWDNNNITVALDYKNGNFISRLKNTDFILKNKETFSEEEDTIEERELVLKGIFPIEQIIQQKQTYAKYNTELELIDGNDTYILNFSLEITRPNTGNGDYRIFVMKGIIYNHETNFPSFVGFEDEITIILAFNAFSNNN